jgi:class 3 adenylate cyclase/pimeloyl-ACP methyl ester carboxylesterase
VLCPVCDTSCRPDQKFCHSCGHNLGSDAGIRPGADADPKPEAYTPSYLAKRILNSRGAVEGELKQVTVLFADVQGSTQLIEGMTSEQAAQRLQPALAAMMDAVHRYEGTVNKLQGDGIMALFGAPLAHEDHAVRACYAALTLQDAVKARTGGELNIRVGLNSGEVVVRAVKNDLSIDYDAVGPTVHLAARMEQAAEPGTIRLTGSTRALAGAFVEVKPLGATAVKGLTKPVDVFVLMGRSATQTTWQARAAGGLTEFVGRTAEMASLLRALALAQAGQGQVIAVIGEAGVGKSRLVQELLHTEAAKGWTVIEAAASAHDANTAYHLVIGIVRSCLGVEERASALEIAHKLRACVMAAESVLLSARPALSSLLDAPVEDVEWLRLDAAQRRRRVLEAVKLLLLWRASTGPLLLAIEDLHWIDAESQAILDELVDGMGGAHVLLVATARPQFRHGWGSKSYYSHVRVDSMTVETADQFLNSLLGEDPALGQLKQLLLAHSDATPLFLEEIVQDLAETGVLQSTRGSYRIVRGIDRIAIPPTVQAVLAARIDRLSPEHKRLLQVAAVIGRDVPVGLLRMVADIPEDELRQGLAALQTAEFLYQNRLLPEQEFRFRHALIHEVAAAALLLEQRRFLHERVGRSIEKLYPARRPALAESLAGHFESGEAWESAAHYWLNAAEKAKSQYSYERGVQFCIRSLSCVEQATGLDEARRNALVLLGNLQSLTGNLDDANRSYERALESASDDTQRRSIECRMHRRGFVSRQGARIAYVEHGEGDDAIFLVIPLAYDFTIFQPLVEELCQEFRMVHIFARGTGPSDPAPWPYRFGEHVEDARAVVETLAAKRAVAVGISYGANLLVRLAFRHPSLLDKLILVGPSLGDRAVGTPFEASSGWGECYLEMLKSGDIEAMAAALIREVFTEPGTEDLALAHQQQLRMVARDTWLNLIDPGPDVEIGPILGNLRVPTLVMHGTEDRSVPLEQGQYIADRIAGATLYLFEGKGHVPVFTATSEFCEVLRQALRGGVVRPSTGMVAG